ncbi:zinc finger protein 62 homolog isoform X5 [Achroia grisella]|uniref:zinc finger protein 62 homolog isoform X5 n=1 Tax=Achroia grisella TaxID=688607 RepID=UPI0027D247E2|nr:zinc finger protein 62 homolog isoform X5 [Achroia grisella]
MAAKTMEWRPGPTVCRCCLAEGCYKDISTEYFWMGKREVYSEMLSETFSVSIAYSTAGGPNSNSRLICEPCISRLRDASDFKRQVQECERTFMQHLDPGSTSTAGCELTVEPEDVKIETVKLEAHLSDVDVDDGPDFGDDDDDDLDDEPLTKFATKVPKKESVDLLDLIDNSKAAEKRKSTTKVKATPAKKTKKETVKPTSSKPKPEKKKKGDPTTLEPTTSRDTVAEKIKNASVEDGEPFKDVYKKEISRNSAINLLLHTTLCPFRFSRYYMCLYCPESYLNMSQLVQHTTAQHNAVGKKELRRVLSRTGKSQPIKVNVIDYGCKLCNAVVTDFNALKLHLVETHKIDIDIGNDGVIPFKINDKEYQCILCKETFVEYRFLNKHVSGHFRNYFCDQCAAGFVTAGRLRVHLKGHQIGPHPCANCEKVFNTLAAKVEHHKRVHAKTKRNICKHCQASFMDYYQKRKHMKDVHGVKNSFKCSFCDKIFLVSSALKAHERQVHLKNMKFTCDICNYQSNYKESIKRHVICHTGEKNFKCEVCKKAYSRRSTLREHMRTHNSDRFVCNFCGRTFVQKSSLKTHVKMQHRNMEMT